FSSRRRHTRSKRDWSSDVCSSDLAYIFTLLFNNLYDWLMTLLPKSLQYNETQNQLILEALFRDNWMLPFLFLDIVILTPIIEELLFRHLIIHELGKKITYAAEIGR